MERNIINLESLLNQCVLCGALHGSVFRIKLFHIIINDQEKYAVTTDKDWIWHKDYRVQKKKKGEEDKTVMQTRLPGETDASNTLGSKGIRLEKRNQAILTEYAVHVLWRVLGTTVSTQSKKSSPRTSRKGYRGELERRKMNTGMVFGDDVAITSIFTGVHNPSRIVNSRKSLIGESRRQLKGWKTYTGVKDSKRAQSLKKCY